MIPALLPTYNRIPLRFERGKGSWLTAEDGTRYLDLGAGIAVNALGHAHPALVAALTEQAGRLWHVSNLYEIGPQQALAERLVGRDLRRHLLLHQLGHRGRRARHQDGAPPLVRGGRGPAHDPDLRGRVPRPVHRRHRRRRAGEDDPRVRPAHARLPHPALGRPRRAGCGAGRHRRGGDGRAGPGRGRHPGDAGPLPQGPARGVRPRGRAAGAGRGAVRGRPDRPALRPRMGGGGARRDDGRQGHRRGLPAGRGAGHARARRAR